MERRIFLAGCCGMSTAMLLRAAEPDSPQWGDLKGRFVYDGDPPEPARLEVTKDVAFVKEPLFDESLLVDKKNRGLANVVVTLLPGKAADMLSIHSSYEEAKAKTSEMAFKNFCFRPRVAVVRTGQEFKTSCSDPVGHLAKWDLFENNANCDLLPPNGSFTTRFANAERLPCPVSCAVHPWETGVLVIADHPYVGVADFDGELSIKQLPVGTWNFRLWHERSGLIKQATVAAKEQKLTAGVLNVEIKPGMNDLGEIKIEPKMLERKR